MCSEDFIHDSQGLGGRLGVPHSTEEIGGHGLYVIEKVSRISSLDFFRSSTCKRLRAGKLLLEFQTGVGQDCMDDIWFHVRFMQVRCNWVIKTYSEIWTHIR
jgi:hypothetical protein